MSKDKPVVIKEDRREMALFFLFNGKIQKRIEPITVQVAIPLYRAKVS